jgi:NDP-sugar pyrophosphorylase family protein
MLWTSGGADRTFVRDGTQLGCRVRYSTDGGRPRGTGGALRHALPLLGRSFMVMYGDSYPNTRFRPVYQAFRRSSLPAMMVVLRNEGRWDASNVEFVNGVVRRHDKVDRTPSMTYIDYGLAVFDSTVLLSRPAEETFDLSDFNRDLAARKLLAGYEVHERFYEIGSPAGLAETDAFLRRALQRPAY